MSGTVRLTTAQALVRFLTRQEVERDGSRRPLLAGCFGIFGHGNVAGIGQALQETPELRYVPCRNEQAMVHMAVAYAKQVDRLSTWACTTSIGPGATNMVTGAALATINRLPVLLLPGDVFATRRVDPVLQQLEAPWSGDLSVNDAFRPVSRYWDRIVRPEQLPRAALAAVRVLTDPAETGAVTLALPQDVQAEAWDFPEELFEPRVWRVARPLPDAEGLRRAVALIRAARRPLLVAGGGVRYSDASDALRRLVDATGIPVAETQAGKGALPFDHPASLGALGATGTRGANLAAREADLVLGVGTRYQDFTTASQTAFQHPDVRFVNVNVAAFDAVKQSGLGLVGDARATLEALADGLEDWQVDDDYADRVRDWNREWDAEVSRLYALGHTPLPAQSEVIGAVNDAARPRDVVLCAAGSMPGDLHKLWRTWDPRGYHLEYGYSCMGYEVAGGIGARLADPTREVYVLVGDGSWLMMSSELVTAVQEGVKITCVLVDNHGYGSIGNLSESVGSERFGTRYRSRAADGSLSGPVLPVDLAANARSLGAHVIEAGSVADLRVALDEARRIEGPVVITIECDPLVGVPGYESWWDVPVAEVSTMETVARARAAYEHERQRERPHLAPSDAPAAIPR